MDITLINKLNKVHNNKYDYSKSVYINARSKITIICPEHGEFSQVYHAHLSGSGCPKCALIKKGKSKNSTTEEFVTKANKVFNGFYDYSLVNYKKAKIPVIIICPEHGEFMQTPNSHTNGKGCPICKESKGEIQIRKILNNLNIKFKPQHKFADCTNKKELPFDFYLPEHNTCIEYQGEQHYKPVKHFGGAIKFLKTKTNDSIKLKYCLNNDIKLIIVNDIDKIYDIIKNNLT